MSGRACFGRFVPCSTTQQPGSNDTGQVLRRAIPNIEETSGAEHPNVAVSGPGGWAVRSRRSHMRQNQAAALLRSLREKAPLCPSALQFHLDALRPEDLHVGPANAFRIASRSGVAYQEIYSGSDMTICIFILRAGAHIPLHDHPGMRVFGRHLFGRMMVRSFDLLPAQHCQQGPRPACWRGDSILGPEPATYGLGPDQGNIHELHALDNCAFFDIITPPYDARAGRHCTYYRLETFSSNGCFLLPVENLGVGMEHQEYQGPAF